MIYLGDCLEIMPGLPAESVDLTVTSPPYDNLRTYHDSLDDWAETKWKAVIAELYRVTVDGGVVVWVVGDATKNGSETGTSFKQALHAMGCGFRLHDTMIYHKEGPPLTHNRYEQKFEYMFVFSKGKPTIFNGLRESAIYAGKSRASTTMRQDSDNLSSRSAKGVTADTRLRGNVWKINCQNGSTTDRFANQHPAIFPETLARDHILSWSDERNIVLDCFMGSGTTGKMAKLLNRNFIGIERDPTYFEIARKRIQPMPWEIKT